MVQEMQWKGLGLITEMASKDRNVLCVLNRRFVLLEHRKPEFVQISGARKLDVCRNCRHDSHPMAMAVNPGEQMLLGYPYF
ncbi:hypothetical protein CEXT_676971 [Caerostris extrusa]|uniref:Uncharacterized protein n=1 Tax=Caerostris extrusa TaxID=172846 RepID=A0AAV4PZP8_CAEEX|nr:hypothetical protein CEXT_676971 [Caerostris extrusa]